MWLTRLPHPHLVRPLISSATARLFRKGKVEFATLVTMLLLAGMLLGFAHLTDEIIDDETRAFDHAVLMAMRTPNAPNNPIGPPWFEEAVRDVTSLGSSVMVVLITAIVVGFLALSGARHAALLIVGSVGSGMLLVSVLKEIIGRTRPDLVEHSARVFTQSFPSGHATLSAITYLTLGALIARVQTRRSLKVYSLTTAMTLTVLVGISRVYLGLHWPTDVIAGWSLGAAWAIGWWFVMLWLQRRGDVERRIEKA
jgi:undecaprenyl-diphosphatase